MQFEFSDFMEGSADGATDDNIGLTETIKTALVLVVFQEGSQDEVQFLNPACRDIVPGAGRMPHMG